MRRRAGAVAFALALGLAAAGNARAQEDDGAQTRRILQEVLQKPFRQAAAARGLPLPEGPVPFVYLENAPLAVYLRDVAFESRNRAAVLRQETFLVALGLLPRQVRLEALLDRIPSGGANVVYEFGQDRFVLGFEFWNYLRPYPTGVEAGRAHSTAVHEAVHWIEERALGLSFDRRAVALEDEDDALLAHRSLVEGTASVVTIEVFLAERDRRLADFEGPLAPAARANAIRNGYGPAEFGSYVFESSVAPVAEGSDFVLALRRRMDWPAFDRRVYPDPPVSMEQILHPDKYLAGEKPVAVEIPAALDEVLGESWTPVGSSTAGELALRVLTGEGPAAGWAGDRYRAYRDASGRPLVVWVIEFDTVEDAVEFGRAFPHIAREQTIRERRRSVIVAGPEGTVSEDLFGAIRSLFD